MSIIIKKKSGSVAVFAQVQEEPLLTELQTQIDLVGTMQEETAEILDRIKAETERLKPFKDEMTKLQKMVDQIESDPDLKLNDMGVLFRLEAGVVGNSRVIKDMSKIRQMMGDALFMKLASVKLGDLDKYMTPPQLAEVLEIDRTTRSVKIIRRMH